MSKTTRHDKTEPCERNFPYIPVGVPVMQVGHPYGRADNRAYVRSLLRHYNPAMSNRLEHELDTIDDELSAGVITLDEAIFRLRIV